MTTQTGERRKIRVGRVVSDGMDKTVVVAVERRVSHRFYGKTIRHLTKFKAHDEQNAFRVGDVVRITETRPLSKTKRWRVTELLVRQELPEIEPAVAAEVNIEEPVASPQRRRGPTKAAVRAAARRAAAGETTPVTAKASKAPKAEVIVEAEDAPAEEETVAAEPGAEAEEAPAEHDAPVKEETAEDTEEEKGS
jgi:small subunit ribosomal protein S17